MSATVEKVDKAPSKKDGPLYEVLHSMYDSQNSIVLEAEMVIQTNCQGWVSRLGSILSEPSNRLPPKFPPSEVLVVRGCVEDKNPAKAVAGDAPAASPFLEDKDPDAVDPADEEKLDTSKASRRGFKRGGK